jgi:hypothetical protein
MRSIFRSASALALFALVTAAAAAPINPAVFKKDYDEKSKDAEVVVQVQVASAVCTEAAGAADNRTVTLQLSLKVLDVEKGPVKKGDVLTVVHKVTLPSGPGPRSYGYMAAQKQFPFTPGVTGFAALNPDKKKTGYDVVVGWVPEPNNTAIPTEVGKKIEAAEKPK